MPKRLETLRAAGMKLPGAFSHHSLLLVPPSKRHQPMVALGVPPLSVMPQRGADTVPVLRGVARRGVDGAPTNVNEQCSMNRAERPLAAPEKVTLI